MQNHAHDNESKEEEEPTVETKQSQAANAEKPTKEQVAHVLRSLSPDQLIELLVPFVQNDPNVYNALVREAESDVHRRKLFVHGVPARTTEEQFRAFFSTFGEVELVELPHAKANSEVKFGFVVFAKLSGLQAALAQPNKFFEGKEICCKAFTVRNPGGDHSPLGGQNNRKVFVSGLPPGITDRDLTDHFRTIGEVEVAQIMPGKSTGFVLFTESSAAREAINKLNRSTWMGRQLSVAWFRKQEDGRLERRASLQSMTSVTSVASFSNPPPLPPAFPAPAGPNWYGYPAAFMQQDPYVLVPVYPNDFGEYAAAAAAADIYADGRGRI